MADYQSSHEDTGAVPGTSQSISMITQATAAMISLALIAGVAVWGYKLMMRDVSGIPIVRAAEGDMRVRPEEPGGQLAEHQGLSVNAVAAHGQAAGPVEQVILAPPDVALAAEDQPIIPVETRQQTAIAVPVDEPAEPVSGTEVVADGTDEPGKPEQSLSARLQQGDIDAVVAELMGQAADTGAATARINVEGAKTVEARVAGQPAAVPSTLLTRDPNPAVATSIRPRPRPANAPALVQRASFTPLSTVDEIDPAAIPSGTRLAQLGAFESAEVARTEWQRMEARFGDILAGKSRVVQQVSSNGRTFYRLRAMGFLDLADTRRFCSAVKAEGVDCIPVQVR